MAGQILSEIRAVLAGAGLAPQHRFGQNFLIDLNLMRKLVDAADLSPADTVLEVGPGTGSLTEILLDRGVRVVAVEIDHGFQAILRERLGTHPRFTLIQADALATKHCVNPLVLKILSEQPPDAGGAYKLVANLPYQIATPPARRSAPGHAALRTPHVYDPARGRRATRGSAANGRLRPRVGRRTDAGRRHPARDHPAGRVLAPPAGRIHHAHGPPATARAGRGGRRARIRRARAARLSTAT